LIAVLCGFGKGRHKSFVRAGQSVGSLKIEECHPNIELLALLPAHYMHIAGSIK